MKTTLTEYIKDLELMYTEAMKAGQYKDALKAKELLGKCQGYFLKQDYKSFDQLVEEDLDGCIKALEKLLETTSTKKPTKSKN